MIQLVLHESTVDKKLIEDTGLEFSLENLDIKMVKGRFRLSYKDILWECLWIPDSRNKLVVVLNGAYERHQYSARFNRWTFQDIFNCCFMSIEDPMYSKYHVPTGWYFGDANHDYCDYVAEIVDYVRRELNIEEVLFYASSAGGTAAIRVANKLHYGTVIALCPQIDILMYRPNSIKAIENIIGFPIQDDPLERNTSIIEGMKAIVNRDVHYVLLENITSNIDNEYAHYIAEKFSKSVEYGVNYLSDNILMWTYEADDGLNAHTAQDWRALLPSILYICNEYYREGRVSKVAVNCINELWYDCFNKQKTINGLLKKADFFLVEMKSGGDFPFVDLLSDVIVGRKSSYCNYWKYSLDKNMVYSCEILCESEDVLNYSIVVYDFEHIVRLYHYKGTIGEREKVIFLTGSNCNDYALLIYAGMHGDTWNKEIQIKELVVSSGQISDMQCSFKEPDGKAYRLKNVDAETERQKQK